MNVKLRILEQAAIELDEIYHWIKERSESGAENWLEALGNAADRILTEPYAAPLAPEDEFVLLTIKSFARCANSLVRRAKPEGRPRISSV